MCHAFKTHVYGKGSQSRIRDTRLVSVNKMHNICIYDFVAIHFNIT